MNENYSLNQIRICPIEVVKKEGKKIFIIPETSEYPYRWCVIDKEKCIAIDVELELKYDYVETINNKYFLDDSYKLIEENKRVAIFPLLGYNYQDDIRYKSDEIVTKLKLGKEYKNGNEIYNNEDYLDKILKDECHNLKIKEKKRGRRVQ